MTVSAYRPLDDVEQFNCVLCEWTGDEPRLLKAYTAKQKLGPDVYVCPDCGSDVEPIEQLEGEPIYEC